MDPFVPKGQQRNPGEHTCGYKPTEAAEHCGKPGTWHVMWDGDPFDNSVTCDEHMQLIQARWMYDDRHPIGADCTMPGALWDYKAERCEFPADGTDMAASTAVEVTA